MTLRSCYRATCDHPGCTAAVMLPHDRAEACRCQLRDLGWIVVKHRVRPETTGAPRISYMCPDHCAERPPGFRAARAAEVRRRAERAPRPRRPVSLDGVVAPVRHIEMRRRAAMLWMLAEVLHSQAPVAVAAGISRQLVSKIIADYDRRIGMRQDMAADWREPWARRLRAAGAIP